MKTVTAHIEAAAKCIPKKKQGAKGRVPWESIAVREKQSKMKKSTLI